MKAICAGAQRESERYWMIMACHKKAIVRRHKDSFVLTTERMAEATIALSLAFFNVPYSYTLLLYYSALPYTQTNILALGIGAKEALCEWRLLRRSSASSREVSESEAKCTSILVAVCLTRHSRRGTLRQCLLRTGQRVALTKAICSPFEAIHAVIAL